MEGFSLPDLLKQVEEQFSKKFELSTQPLSHKLPDVHRWFPDPAASDGGAFPSIPELEQLKTDLNATKSLLNDMPSEAWHCHTRTRNPASGVVPLIRAVAKNPELLTTAWCKFTECLVQYELVRPEDVSDGKDFRSAHLCEAPGAFITSLNHHLYTAFGDVDVVWKWTGTTLNPYFEANPGGSTINDDRFILQTLDNWVFGPDDTGNILCRENMRHLIQVLKHERDGMHLITADGSVDCQADPGNQEGIVSRLHLAEIVAALACLRPGGHFVIKMFTFYEASTVCHLLLLCHHFEEVHVFKPATSKEGNSEVYVVCKGFRADLGDDALQVLIDNVTVSGLQDDVGEEFCKVMFLWEDVPDSFKSQVVQCATFFKDIQTKVILGNISAFTHCSSGSNQELRQRWDEAERRQLKKLVAEKYLELHGVRPLDPDKTILYRCLRDKRRIKSIKECLHLDHQPDEEAKAALFLAPPPPLSSSMKLNMIRLKTAELQGRLDRLATTTKQRQQLQLASTVRRCANDLKLIRTVDVVSNRPLSVVTGKRFEAVVNSKFCPRNLLLLYSEVAKIKFEISKASRGVDADSSALSFTVNDDEDVLKLQVLVPPSVMKAIPDLLVPNGLTRVLDLGCPEDPLASTTNGLKLAKESLKALEECSREGYKHLVVKNFPLLTRVAVGILTIATSAFNVLGFVAPRGLEDVLLLADFKGPEGSASAIEKLSVLLAELQQEEHEKSQVVQVLPVNVIASLPWYPALVVHNTESLIQKAAWMLRSMSDISECDEDNASTK